MLSETRTHAFARAIPPAPTLEHWGRVAYREAWQRQLVLWQRRLEAVEGDRVVIVEHPSTITLGRHGSRADVLLDALSERGRAVAVVESDRGGQATYHGPGQIVVYPIVDIAARGLGVKTWVALLEDAMLSVLTAYGIAASRIAGRPGVYVGNAKIASIGLRVARGVSYHGISLNVAADVSGFDLIVTCGVAGQAVTSIATETGIEPPLEEVGRRLYDAICTGLGSCRG